MPDPGPTAVAPPRPGPRGIPASGWPAPPGLPAREHAVGDHAARPAQPPRPHPAAPTTPLSDDDGSADTPPGGMPVGPGEAGDRRDTGNGDGPPRPGYPSPPPRN